MITIDEFIGHITQEQKFLKGQWLSVCNLPDTLKRARQNFIAQYGRESLTQEEKRQAFLDEVLKLSEEL